MGFSFANVTRWLLPASVALAAACSTQAQPSGQGPGKAIIFSAPDDDAVSSNMPSLVAKQPGLLDLANTVRSPALNFGAASMPAPRLPAVSPSQIQRMQRLLDERKNWTLLTPEEILGLPTREKILGIQDLDAFGQPKNETVIEQYYERQEQLRARTNDYNFGEADSSSQKGLFGVQETQMNPNIWSPAGGKPASSTLMNQVLNGTPDNRTTSARAPENTWPKSFDLPAPSPDHTMEQQAALEQFQQLLQQHSLAGGTAKAPALGSPIFFPMSTTPTSLSGQAVVIPIGASFTPLSSGIAMPTGVTPLPSLLGQNNTATTPAPEWKPELPPWMSSAPQPDVIPQRKF